MSDPLQLDGIIGSSPAMQVALRVIQRVAAAETTLIIRGESGTGKGLAAHTIHNLGPRADAPFVIVDCASIPAALMESELFGHEQGAFTDARTQTRGVLETANGGTVLLDEIGLMPVELQGKLLHVLETRTFRRVGGTEELSLSVRFMAATNEDLQETIKAGRFRLDLYYRLNVIAVDLPPLRDRDDDVIFLAEAFLEEFVRLRPEGPQRLGSSAVGLLRSYQWPGNVRELRNVLERAVVMTDRVVIRAEDLAVDMRTPHADQSASGSVLRIDGDRALTVELPEEGIDLEEVEQELVRAALARTSGKVAPAARLLKLTRETLRYRINKYNIDPTEYAG